MTESYQILATITVTSFLTWLAHKIGMLFVGIVDDVGWKETHFRKLVLLLVRLCVFGVIGCGGITLFLIFNSN